MRDVKAIIGNLKNTIQIKSRNGYQAVAKTAARLRSRSGHLTQRLRRLSKISKSRT